MSEQLPDQGVVFWPVGTGDSTTVVVDGSYVLQVDIHHQKQADGDSSVVVPVVDRLIESLPRTDDDRPYLAAFALTHADLDHCKGFGLLLDSEVLIGELWATPRLWRESTEDGELVEDARRFHEEANRRVQATLDAVADGRQPSTGDRIRVIGVDQDADELEYDYAALPPEYLTYPGQEITTLDGNDVSDHFSAFIHAPFKDDCAKERNETSLAMHIQLRSPEHSGTGGILLFGDLAYETLSKIFNYSKSKNAERLAWDIMLAPHHCSKKVMYAPGEDGQEEKKQDILDLFAEFAGDIGYVIASASPFREVDETGHNPPHLLARDAYDEIAPSGVVCTGEYPDAEAPHPIVFALEPDEGLVLVDLDAEMVSKSAERSGSGAALLAALATTGAVTWIARQQRKRGLAAASAAVSSARGGDADAVQAVGFGDGTQ